jgi:hypothetical protein
VSPWRPYLAYAAVGLTQALAVAAFWLALSFAPHWLEHSRNVRLLGLLLVGGIATAVGLEIASMIHPPTARMLEMRQYRSPEHWVRGMRRQSENGLIGWLILMGAAGATIAVILGVSVLIHDHF